MNAIFGTKIGQTQTFTQDGKRIAVTVVAAGPCWVTHITEFGGFRKIQLAYDSAKHTTKALAGHIKKSGLTIQPRFLREIRVKQDETLTVGTEIKVGEVFTIGDVVRVTGTSKGKGFAGVVKRHHFSGGPKTHGQSDRERAPGSIGQTTTPGRVYKGKRMAGRMGSERVTVRGLRVVTIDPEKNLLTLTGVVPGGRNGLLLIQKEN
jgi:large subunit ribosomal protein L3